MKKIQFENESVAKAFKDFMKIDASIEEEDGKFAVAYCEVASEGEDESEEVEKKLDYVKSEISYLHNRISNLAEAIYRHMDNHLPNPKTPSQMKTALDALGMGDDYEVEKKKIYASTDIEPLELA